MFQFQKYIKNFNKVVVLLTIADVFSWGPYFVISTLAGIYLSGKLGANAIEFIGVGTAIYYFTRALTQIPIGYITDKIKKDRDDIYFLIFGIVLRGIPYLFYPLISSPWHFYVLQLIFGLGASLNLSTWRKLFAMNIDYGREGKQYGFYETIISLSTVILSAVIAKMEKYLLKKGVEILDNTEVTDILVKGNKISGVVTKTEKTVKAPIVLLAPGRVRASWLQKLANKYDIKYMYDKVEVGVRVEFLAPIMKRQSDLLYETVYKVRTKTYHDIIRTFCSCPNGEVATENYDGYICVNGHSKSDHKSKNSNFAFVSEVSLTEPVENSIAYAKSIAEVASTIGGGKPLLQSLEDLHCGRRSTWSRLSKSFVTPTLTDVTPGDIAMALPYRIVKNIEEGLDILDKVMPGINGGSTLLYAPEVKFRSSKICTDSGLQTCIKGLYVAGDAAGVSGSITGAAVTGIMFAKSLI